MKKELIDKVVEGLRSAERYTYLNADKGEKLNKTERCEVANQMRADIYCYQYDGYDYYFTLPMLIEDFYAYISGMMSVEDDLAYMSFSDYMEHFSVQVYKYNKTIKNN